MTQGDMLVVMEDVFKRCQDLRLNGQKEYAHEGKDAFENFNKTADQLDIDRKEVLWIYFHKHIQGILAHIKGHESQREDVTGRIGDAITYLCLLEGMILEERHDSAFEREMLGSIISFTVSDDEPEQEMSHVTEKESCDGTATDGT